MEVSRSIVDKAVCSINPKSGHNGLQILLSDLASYDTESILLKDQEIRALRELDSKIYQVITGTICELNREQVDPDITAFINVLSTVKQYLLDSISKTDIKLLLVFLSVNCYLKIDISRYLSNDEVSSSNRSKLSEKILYILRNINFEMKIDDETSYYARSINAEAEEVFREQDIEKIYDRIEGIERSLRGFHFNFLLESLIDFLFQFDKQSCLKALSLCKTPEECVFYLQSFGKEDLLAISKEGEFDNKWVIVELMRQIIQKVPEEFTSEEQISILKLLRNLYENHLYIFYQSVTFFHRGKLYNSSLGKFLANATTADLHEVFENRLPLNIYDFNLDARTILLSEFAESASEIKYRLALKVVFNRWQNLSNNIATSEDGYLSALLLTDYANFIVQYYVAEKDDNDLTQIINSILWIDSEWFATPSKQITKFHLYMTDLYLLSFVFKNRSLPNNEIISLLRELKVNAILRREFFRDSKTHALMKIEENFAKETY